MKNRTIAGIILAIFFASTLGCAWFFAFQTAMADGCYGFQDKSPDCEGAQSAPFRILHHVLVFSQIQHAASLLLFGALMGLISFLACLLFDKLRGSIARCAGIFQAQTARAIQSVRVPFREFLFWLALHEKRDPDAAFAGV
ncbi:MAG: hypothetical protein HYV78_00570 [Candidatus Wildermuthbacteria bacterium]|nr:hypothetical protein [Candidatus Wildermuthbacteria bacterium]